MAKVNTEPSEKRKGRKILVFMAAKDHHNDDECGEESPPENAKDDATNRIMAPKRK